MPIYMLALVGKSLTARGARRLLDDLAGPHFQDKKKADSLDANSSCR